MSIVNTRWALALACAGALSIAACGGGDKSEKTVEQTSTGGEVQSAEALAAAPMRAAIEGAGYTVVRYKPFPAQLPARIGSIVVYQDKSGKQGGVLYFQKSGKNADNLYWHWYFKDAAPDSALAVELNDDGLWDVRVFTEGGNTIDFTQDKDFTFTGAPRRDLIAMNGDTSDQTEVWRCFDGDSTSAWVADLSKGDAYIELPTPFGVEAGVLVVRADGDHAPRGIEVRVDGKKVKDAELVQTGREQRVQLESVGVDSRSLRLEFKSGYAGNSIGIAELGIK